MSNSAGLRPRIRVRDAKVVRARLQARAAELKLRCGTLLVLNAVLALLVGWKRIRDDQLRLSQVCAQFPAGARWLSPTTVGRLLAKLAALELITYQPARGRAACAEIAIHPAFLDGIYELQRDSAGRVVTDNLTSAPRPGDSRGGSGSADNCPLCARLRLQPETSLPPVVGTENVNFSREPFLIGDLSPKTPLPPAADGDFDHELGSRPTAVAVDPGEVREVHDALPKPFASLPKHLRWLLGEQIRARLAAGWRPDQILEALCAPMPAEVRRLYRLAVWRLAQNMPGAGPRLTPLQQAWDRRDAAAKRRADADADARWYAAVTAVTSDDERSRLLRADTVKFGRRSANPTAALAHAGRMATRRFPGVELWDALRRWADDVLGNREQAGEPLDGSAPTSGLDVLAQLGITGDACALCGAVDAVGRPQLAIAATRVCDRCWVVAAPPELRGDTVFDEVDGEMVPA